MTPEQEAKFIKFIDETQQELHRCRRRALALERLVDDDLPEAGQVAADIHTALDRLWDACHDAAYDIAPGVRRQTEIDLDEPGGACA